MKEEKISIYRVIPILGMLCSALFMTAILSIMNKLKIDQLICMCFLVVSFMPILLLEMLYERKNGMISENEQTTYSRLGKGFLLCCFATIVISLFPEYLRPVLVLPLIMSAFSNEVMALIISLFLNVLLAMTTGGSYYELLAYVLMSISASLLTRYLNHKEYRLYIGAISFFISVLFPNIFSYLANQEVALSNLFICSLNGFVAAIYIMAYYPYVKERTENEVQYNYQQIISDDYFMVKEIQQYFPTEYQHARRVSALVEKYAKELGLNADLAAAAGFYYRMGKWEGEPYVENGVKKAENLCFPKELIQILWEYNGIFDLPSTPESALVHIVDGMVIKLELFENEVGTSKWNREVLIYQTLNDYSTSGIYDRSGLSINAFIKVREWLAKEE